MCDELTPTPTYPPTGGEVDKIGSEVEPEEWGKGTMF